MHLHDRLGLTIPALTLTSGNTQTYLDFVIEALVEEFDAEAQVFTVLLLLPEQLSLAVIAERGAVLRQALLYFSPMRVHASAHQLCIFLQTYKETLLSWEFLSLHISSSAVTKTNTAHSKCSAGHHLFIVS